MSEHARAAARAGSMVRPDSRGFIIVAVLIIVAIGALVAASVLSSSRVVAQRVRLIGDAADSDRAAVAAQHACQQLLLRQRDALLRGGAPELPERIVLFEHAGMQAVARLIPVRGRAIRPTGARLDINAATDEQLRLLQSGAGLDSGIVDALIAARDGRTILSLEDLIDGRDITPELVHGDIDEFIGLMLAPGGTGLGRMPAPTLDMPEIALADLLTVYSADPNVQIGIDPDRADAFGRNRINLNRPFSDALADAIRREFSDDLVNIVRGLIVGQGVRFTDDRVVARTLAQFELPPSNWGVPFDAFTTSPDPFLRNRIDLNAAPAAVLATLPGLPTDAGERIAAARDRVDLEDRASPTWVVGEGVVSPAEYIEMAAFVAARSLQFELLIETGYEPVESNPLSLSADGQQPLRARRLTEITIDLSAPRPRTAAIRDATHLPLALGMWTVARRAEERESSIARISMEDWEMEPPDTPDPPGLLSGSGIPGTFFRPGVSVSPPDSGDQLLVDQAAGPEPVDRRAGRWRPEAAHRGGGPGS